MDKAGPSWSRRSRSRRSRTQITPDGDVRSVHSRDEDWDVPQAQKKLKGKIIQPEGSRRLAFQRLGHEGRNQNRPAKERLGVETTPLSAFDRLGRGAERPGQTRCTKPPHREEPQHSRAPHEEEAESHPRHMFRSHVEQPRDRVGRVEARLEKLQRRVDRDEKKKILLNESPFTDRVHETPFPKKAKLEVPKFTGKEDPEIHVKTLHQSGRMMGLSGDEKCLLFFQTLRGRAAEWFHNLPAGEIDSFDELAEREHEDLTKFLTRWKDEVDKVEEMDDKTAMSLLVSGLRFGELYKEFCRRPPQSYQEAYNTAWDYADAEAQVSSKREAEQGHSKGKISLKKEIEQPGKAKAEVMEVKPVKSEKNPTGEKQWTEKYCSFHKTESHNTAECNSVKGVIKQMIEAGEIDLEYLAQAKQKKNQWIRLEGKPVEQNKKKKAPGKEHLQVIYGGPEGGDSASQRKKWGRELYVGTVALNPRSVNVLYLDAFEKLKLCRTRLEPLKTPLSGFTGDSVEAEGSILLTCELGTGDQVVQKQMRFVVVNIKCVHNAILGRPGINKVRGVISMAHLCMKFYTPGGIGQVRGDQKKVRSYYLEALKKMTKAFERVTLVSQEEERSKLEPCDETEQIVLREAFPERMVRIGRDLPRGLREEIISVLREYAEIFAWSVADMPGIDRSVICHRLAVMEGQALADFLVELTGLEPEAGPSHTIESWWDMAVDGASGPKGCGAGVVFTTPEGFKIYHALVFNFKLTNNEALAGGLILARALGIKRMKIRSDSSLVVGQVNGEMEEFHLTRIPWSENTDADMLSKLTQACPEHVSKFAKIEILDVPSADRFEVAAIQPGQTSATGIIGEDDDWRYDLMEYLETGQKPDDEERARKVVLRAPRFQVIDGHLYKRAIGGPLLRCLTNPEAERVLAEVHEGVCAAHQMSRTLAQRIILLGYYWPTIIGDCERYVRKCRTCQVFYKHPGRPATYYQPTSNVLPFARFGIDIMGAFLVAQGGKKFVMVAIDYFTKWVEAEAMATITVRQCEKFVWKNIITRFGAPKIIVTDNCPQFRNPRFTAYLASFGIKHSKASVAYPQGNGQVENANRTIVDGLKKRLGEEGHKWLEALPHTVWAHRVTSRRATGETPFVLTYGCEARLPVEAEIPTFRETVYQPGQNEADHLAELNLVEERRTIAAVKMAGYQQSVKRYHDNRVGPRYFQVHDEVLRRRDASKPNERGKLVRNSEGPYRVKAIVRPGTYQLETMEGGRVDRHWNSHHLRKFFR
ncbi:unnamed protein product [Cuscuta campestris]|uniref:Integrase catalytic domain-containing protein n=1 Tax=Cuscuta campestris TaxID=132261 RepID=A0A484MYH7_9ASTE|nr:unnamed protein product [Cuscuta campestris]